MDIAAYRSFIAAKGAHSRSEGFAPGPLPDRLFPHQRAAVEFACQRGRAAAFLDTGLGKSGVEAVFAEEARRASGKPALILTPLAVARQMQRECEAFGIEARVVREDSEVWPGVNIANYERLPKLDTRRFGAVVLDESSILKSFTGPTKRMLCEAFAETPYRLAATATPAPNDHMEIGQHAEFLGHMGSMEMLCRWFVNDTSTASQDWRLKGHAAADFWRWVASWARAASLPSDLGGEDAGFALPPLHYRTHVVQADVSVDTGGALFRLVDNSATSVHAEKRRTLAERVKRVVSIVRLIEDQSCLGSQNTPSVDASEPLKILSIVPGGTRKETEKTESTGSDICNTTTATTGRSGNGLPKRKRGSTNGSASATPRTQSMPQSAESGRDPAIPQLVATRASDQPTGSMPTPTLPCCDSKAESAPSAESLTQRSAGDGSMSTTATKLEPSEDCSAHLATQLSGSYATTSSDCGEPSSISNGLAAPWLIFCETNDEQDALEDAFGDLCISIRGSDSAEKKERDIERWLAGERPIFISKPKIVGYGLNFQHCHQVIFASISHSYEQHYQAVRRLWRFGQTEPVTAHVVLADTEYAMWMNVRRKADDHDKMKKAMARAMREAQVPSDRRTAYTKAAQIALPTWMNADAHA